MKHRFRDLKDSKSFNISLLASLFVVFIMTAIDLYECYIPKITQPNYICQRSVPWTWVVFVILLILVFIEINHYLSLVEIQEEIDIAKIKSKK